MQDKDLEEITLLTLKSRAIIFYLFLQWKTKNPQTLRYCLYIIVFV